MFGQAFNGAVVRRFLAFVRPYRAPLWLSLAAVLVFTFTQMAIPLIIRVVIDDALLAGAASTAHRLLFRGLCRVRRPDRGQLRGQPDPGIGGGTGGGDGAVRPAPRHVRASAAGRAGVHGPHRGGPPDGAAAGRRKRPAGVSRIHRVRGRRPGAAGRHHRDPAADEPAAGTDDPGDRAGTADRARPLAAARAACVPRRPADQRHRQRRTGGEHQRGPVDPGDGPPAGQLRPLRGEGVSTP